MSKFDSVIPTPTFLFGQKILYKRKDDLQWRVPNPGVSSSNTQSLGQAHIWGRIRRGRYHFAGYLNPVFCGKR